MLDNLLISLFVDVPRNFIKPEQVYPRGAKSSESVNKSARTRTPPPYLRSYRAQREC